MDLSYFEITTEIGKLFLIFHSNNLIQVINKTSLVLNKHKYYINELALIDHKGYIEKLMNSTFEKKKLIKTYTNLTQFQKDVLVETLSIPKGKTITYQELARRINRPKAYRAVGSALAKNPFPYIIPCHRVINTNSKIGNFAWGREIKEKLLKLET